MDHKQLERQQRGEDFQNELRRSWRLVPNCWRLRIADGRGGARPGDELILLKDVNILGEHKRTTGDRFEFSFLEVNQVKGLLDFDAVIDRNIGLVFVSFLNEAVGRDLAVTFRLALAMKYMQEKRRKYITIDEFNNEVIPCLWLPRLQLTEGPGYDLKGVNDVTNTFKP